MSDHDPRHDGQPQGSYDPRPDAYPQPEAEAPTATPYSSPTAPPYGYAPGSAQQYGQQYGQPYGPSEPYAPSEQYAGQPYVTQGYAAQPYGAQVYGAYPYQYYGAPPAAPGRSSRRFTGAFVGVGAAAAAFALVLGGVALADSNRTSVAGSGGLEAVTPPTSPTLPVDPNTPLNPNGGSVGGPGSGAGSSSRTQTATATQQIGIVTIVSTLKYQNAQSAGTGMVVSSDGEILTNNHVIRGSTSIVVTVESTGKAYRADVVGTAPASDVAVIKLRGASGLQTAKLAGSATDVSVGDAVTGVGNAGGTGTLTAASGKVTALNQAITATDEQGADAEQLKGLIEVDAHIISGDSGGPLYDSAGEIVGINTAASSQQASATTSTGYAIPIENAVAIADQIEKGTETAAIHIGYPGFLGVSTQDANGKGAGVANLLDGGPAAAAGITPGSVITAVDGRSVSSAASLRTILTAEKPGTKVTITWTDSTGASKRATVTLATGPAD